MLQLRVFGAQAVLGSVAEELESLPGARHVMLTSDGMAGKAVVTVDLVDDAVDAALGRVKLLRLPPEDVVVLRLDTIGAAAAQRPLASVVWADLLTQAGANATPPGSLYGLHGRRRRDRRVRSDLLKHHARRRRDGDQPTRFRSAPPRRRWCWVAGDYAARGARSSSGSGACASSAAA